MPPAFGAIIVVQLRGYLMSTKPSNFRQRDVRRLLQGVKDAGLRAQRVEQEGTRIIVVLDDGNEVAAGASNNPWDKATADLRQQ